MKFFLFYFNVIFSSFFVEMHTKVLTMKEETVVEALLHRLQAQQW